MSSVDARDDMFANAFFQWRLQSPDLLSSLGAWHFVRLRQLKWNQKEAGERPRNVVEMIRVEEAKVSECMYVKLVDGNCLAAFARCTERMVSREPKANAACVFQCLCLNILYHHTESIKG